MGQSPGWPYSTPPHWAENITLSPANPAAGANLDVAIPGNALWQLFSLSFIFTTAIAVANRNVTIQLSDGAVTYLLCPAQFQQVASTTVGYQCFHAGYDLNGSPFGQAQVNLPPNIWLPQGYHILTFISNIQAADQISSVRVHALEWLVRNA